MASRLVLALDETNPARALDIAKEVAPFVAKIKINYPLVLSAGLEIVKEISKFSPVICDFKVADIPNTIDLLQKQLSMQEHQELLRMLFLDQTLLKQ